MTHELGLQALKLQGLKASSLTDWLSDLKVGPPKIQFRI